MAEDHIKRFNLNTRSVTNEFRPPAAQGPTIKTKDNAQPVIPPPKTTFIPHPRLAPPGMMGSRLAREASAYMAEKRETDPRRKEFKPFPHDRDKTRGWER